MEDLNKLIELASQEVTKKKAVRVFHSKSVDSFIKDLNLESGDIAIPNELLFYHYRIIHAPESSKVSKIMFFKIIHGRFPSTRKNKQRFVLLKEGSITINEELINKAKEYDKKYWQKSKKV